MIYENNYKKLLHLIPDLETASFEARKLKADGFMDLNIDMLYKEEDRTVMALSHYYKHPSGDMIADPDMEIAVYPERKMVEALSYQDALDTAGSTRSQAKSAPAPKGNLIPFSAFGFPT